MEEVKVKVKNKNNGKKFEQEFQASVPEGVWHYRPKDQGGGMNARFTSESLCDMMAFDNRSGVFYLMELKSTVGSSIGFRPFSEYEDYLREKELFETTIAGYSANEKKVKAVETKEWRKALRLQYKELNKASIKLHQIMSLWDAERENTRLFSYFLFTFLNAEITYLVPIEGFVKLWKSTTKKSLNAKDLDELVESGDAVIVPQEKIGKSSRFHYDIDSVLFSEKNKELKVA